MTLFELIARIEIQGKVRLSVWDSRGDEIEVLYLEDRIYGIDDALYNKEVTYMFAGDDGYLHIELNDCE